MARRDATFVEVYDAILARLRDQLGLHDRQVFLTVDPLAPAFPVGSESFTLTLSPGNLIYEDDMLLIGHPGSQVCVSAGAVVAPVIQIWQDDVNTDYQVLMDAERGLFEAHRKIVRAMTANDLTLADGSEFLRELPRPVGAAPPQTGTITAGDGDEAEQIPIAWSQIEFRISFDLSMA